MFGRRSTSDKDAPPDTGSTSTAPAFGKGRATPKRREAEAARKQRLTTPKSRREANRQLRQRRFEERSKMQDALRGGDDRYLPKRDQGRVRRFVRDLVDTRFNVAEFLLPLLLLILVLGVVGQTLAQGYVWFMTIVGSILDTSFLWWRLKRELRTRFPDDDTKGAVLYGILRSSQLRRLRLPKPQLKRTASLPERY